MIKKNAKKLLGTLILPGILVMNQLVFSIIIVILVQAIVQYSQDQNLAKVNIFWPIKDAVGLGATLILLGIVVMGQLVLSIIIGKEYQEIIQYLHSQKMIKRTEFLRSLLKENAETVKKIATLMGIKIVLGEKTNVARILIPVSITGIKDHNVLGKFLGSVIKVFSEPLDYQTLVWDLKKHLSIPEIKEVCEAMKERHSAISENLRNAILKVETNLAKEEKQKEAATRQRSGKEELHRGLKVWGINPKRVVTIFK